MARVLTTMRSLAAALGFAGMALAGEGTANPGVNDAASAPRELHFCAANCFTLLLRNGIYIKPDGSAETWGIEKFSGDTVILHRHDSPAQWNLFQADSVYKGTIANDRLVNITIAGQAAPPIVRLGWGSALAAVPGNNAERDRISDAQSNSPNNAVQPFGVNSGLWEIETDHQQQVDTTAMMAQVRKTYDALEAGLSPEQRAAVEKDLQQNLATQSAAAVSHSHKTARFCLTAHGLNRGYLGVFDASNIHSDGCHGTAAGSATLLTSQLTCPQANYTVRFEAIDSAHFKGSMLIDSTVSPPMHISNGYKATWVAAQCPNQTE